MINGQSLGHPVSQCSGITSIELWLQEVVHDIHCQ
jgi:hypothetical protein